MTVFISLVMVCGFAVLQSYGDQEVTIQIDRSNDSSGDESKEKSSLSPAQPNNIQAQYEIVRLCTSIPATYDDIMNMYLSTGNTIKPRELQMRMADLKSQSTQLSGFVNDAYATPETEQELDPVRKELLSRNADLTQALLKLQKSLANKPQPDTAKKVAFLVSDIRPPLIDFQTACLAETKDIVNNMLADLRDNSNNVD